MPLEERTPVVVLGAKPESDLPNVPAETVFAANGAVEVACVYRERFGSVIVGLCPSVELRKHVHIQESVMRAAPDQMIMFGNDPDIVNFIREELGLRGADIILLNNKERRSLMWKVLGWRMLFVIVERIKVRGMAFVFRRMIPDIFFNRDKDWLMHSTGLDSIMYSMLRFPDKIIVAAGIGLQGGEHFNGVGEFMIKTAKADRGTMAHWPLSRRRNVYTTDPAMNELGKVPLWKGEMIRL